MSLRRDMDRVARERAAQQRDTALQSAAAEMAAIRSESLELKAKAARIIPSVLEKLAAQGYPGLTQIDVVARTRIGRRFRTQPDGPDIPVRVSGYRVSQIECFIDPYYLLLLSDGRIGILQGSCTLSEFVERVLQHEAYEYRKREDRWRDEYREEEDWFRGFKFTLSQLRLLVGDLDMLNR